MADPEARFAAEFGRSVNRWDWWRLRSEHTPFQWALQQTLARVAPYGDARADMRAAITTANLMVMQMANSPDDDKFAALIESLRDYLKDASDYEDRDDIEAARRIRERKAD